MGLGVGKHLKLTTTGNGFLGEQGKVTEKHQDRHFIIYFCQNILENSNYLISSQLVIKEF